MAKQEIFYQGCGFKSFSVNSKTELPGVQSKNRNGGLCEFHHHHLKKKGKEEEKEMEGGNLQWLCLCLQEQTFICHDIGKLDFVDLPARDLS